MTPAKHNQQSEDTTTSVRSKSIKWIVAILLLLFAAAAAMNLPRGYSDDLSRIGTGLPTVVLVRDKNAVSSYDLSHVLDGIRDQYAGRVEFLLTDYDTAQGRAFMAAHHAASVTLVLLDGTGKAVSILRPPQNAEKVQREIDGVLGVHP